MIGLACEYRTGADADRPAPPGTLLEIRYGAAPGPGAGHPVLRSPLRPLGADRAAEYWTHPGPVRRERLGRFDCAVAGEVLAGVYADPPGCDHIECETRSAYRELLDEIARAGYPSLLRTWNHLGRIHEVQRGLDRYALFCRGRHDAFADRDPRFEERLPAASTVGSREGGLGLCFLASRVPGRPVENPRQQAAYRYPERYGPRSPSFARALHWTGAGAPLLLLSGTASVVGHETVHPDRAAEQLEVTLENLEALVGAAGDAALGPLGAVKVYVRRAEDAERVRARLEERLGPGTPLLQLEADICRKDLVLEIEGLVRAG